MQKKGGGDKWKTLIILTLSIIHTNISPLFMDVAVFLLARQMNPRYCKLFLDYGKSQLSFYRQ